MLSYPIAGQFASLGKGMSNAKFNIEEIGEQIPAAIMMHDIIDDTPVRVSYMSEFGCNLLGTSVEEINHLGLAYYEKYFVKEEVEQCVLGLQQYISEKDPHQQYSFFQQVKLHNELEYKWFYTICKLVQNPENDKFVDQLMIIATPIEGCGNMVNKVNKVLDDHDFVKQNYRRYAALTKREKEIIRFIANGASSKEIADSLFVSVHTINTHRKNIIQKLDCKTFAAFLKFAIAFDLI
ncbi:helix-turn-helix transcriptional regulator [Sphingobacterium hotanense]|uniref:Helix-turn-helix transcriptional regulator n=1 Tax=Sphingobacterium hotanense TaxID=649196 RepID=A0ABT7NTE3_9SPHI|nr:helix-turn-helix transcriptional regulator [Sphingobacterium hotanense]MCT1524355.1 helix-turn-helix transcriptional regulator [Sphingobacterium hotanense]MDM1050508.1 helix-turn-helix transcriptional regulator [Sphingobacterium hotanense]